MSLNPLENTPYSAVLLLADGQIFFGEGCGARGVVYGEMCFNTAMTGYQEIMTDPSYAGQIITFTTPHIGNVGANEEDIESGKAGARGLVMREPISVPSNFRSDEAFDAWLSRNKVTGISGIDTRALTRALRTGGVQNAAIFYAGGADEVEFDTIKETLSILPSLAGMELAQSVSTLAKYEWKQKRWSLDQGFEELKKHKHHVVAVDFGKKMNIMRCLASVGCKVTVVPATASAENILALKPSGVFLSNGPGDPAATFEYAGQMIKALLDKEVPIFGICLGHQLLSLAMGAKTEKMYQGHRGANHPVKRVADNVVEITSQNHGFVVCRHSLPSDIEVTHVSLFDGTIEGVKHAEKPAFSVQYHPESSPGPHDSLYLFDQFVEMMQETKDA